VRRTLAGPAGGRPQPGAPQAALDYAHRGNPFFLEESVRTLVETGVLVGEPGAYRLTQALPTIQVRPRCRPCWRHALTGCRPEEKRLLQTAAVVGTEVPLSLLQAIVDMP